MQKIILSAHHSVSMHLKHSGSSWDEIGNMIQAMG